MDKCSNAGNNKNCTCTYTSCSRHGNCCQCVEYHKKSNEIPGCFFSKEAEKTYNRSVEYFIRSSK